MSLKNTSPLYVLVIVVVFVIVVCVLGGVCFFGGGGGGGGELFSQFLMKVKYAKLLYVNQFS